MILLHICCGPCALYPVSCLRQRGLSIKGFFYNPNIHPYQEYQMRIQALEKVAQIETLEIIWHREYDLEYFLEETLFRWQKPKRCERCYYLRLKKCAELAVKLRAEAFTTTLLQSPFQYHELIRDIGKELESRYKIPFYYEDWRVGYKEGKNRAKTLALYLQRYCGCIFSEKERYLSRS
ncbi:MAG: epoxyqueuosine reductase QueH [Caldimicrobium sp.]|nr:epoxyqueuosine reductase QueH [Caldimicrobium sp.]MCX7873024.1 epoxyqueuosine reductase QueH [Caldimicrobium sp.]MDW8094839.1 epoxyqueuosine reductase QueH [Caldimicrobium sp.]